MDARTVTVIGQQIMNSLPVGLVIIDAKGEIKFANQAACTILGHTQEEFKANGWGRLFIDIEKNVEFNNVVIEAIRLERLNLRREVPYTHPDGSIKHLSIISSYLQEGGENLGIAIIIDDLTELHDLYARERDILTENSRAQQEKARSLNQLALAVAHQVRNPMVAIGGFAKLLLRKVGPDSPLTEYLNNIVMATTRLESIVTAVKNYSAIAADRYRRVRAYDIVSEARRRVDEVLAASGAKAEWRLSVEHHDIVADPGLLTGALYEIMLNAAESYPGSSGVVEVETSHRNGVTAFVVRDKGRGISEEDLPYIFDPFFTTKAVGVGMGLCRALRAVSEHKGRLTVASPAGQGTQAIISLPDEPYGQHGNT